MVSQNGEGSRLENRRDRIAACLTAAFSPTYLDIVDESHRHKGHAGHQEGGETHFRVVIVAGRFAGQSRLARHRAVHDALAAEFSGGLHALAVEAKTPAEAGQV